MVHASLAVETVLPVALEQGSTVEPARALSIGIKELGSWAPLPEKCPWAPVPGHAAQWHAGDKYTPGDSSSDNRSQRSACTACAQMHDKARGCGLQDNHEDTGFLEHCIQQQQQQESNSH